jgi:hypothetical protein
MYGNWLAQETAEEFRLLVSSGTLCVSDEVLDRIYKTFTYQQPEGLKKASDAVKMV